MAAIVAEIPTRAQTMLFLDLYGVPRAPSDAPPRHLPQALRTLLGKIESWRRGAYDRRMLAGMTMRQLEDLQLSWPDDIRNIRAHS
jgi:uncharacterized protein YjiS (DUF1127 family)